MGMFDEVVVVADSANRFCCSEGHSLVGLHFQTKDFACVMDVLTLDEGLLNDGEWRALDNAPFDGHVRLYASCYECPVFLQHETGNMLAVWVEFDVTFKHNHVVEMRRTSRSTKQWLAGTPKEEYEYMHDALGPLPYALAQLLHADGVQHITFPDGVNPWAKKR